MNRLLISLILLHTACFVTIPAEDQADLSSPTITDSSSELLQAYCELIAECNPSYETLDECAAVEVGMLLGESSLDGLEDGACDTEQLVFLNCMANLGSCEAFDAYWLSLPEHQCEAENQAMETCQD